MRSLLAGAGVLGGVGAGLIFGAPLWLSGTVPLAPDAAVPAYIGAARAVKTETAAQSTDGRPGVEPSWEDAIALDAALLGQVFPAEATPELAQRAHERALDFVERHVVYHDHCVEVPVPAPPPPDSTEPPPPATVIIICSPETHVWYTLRPLSQVMAIWGLTAQEQAWVLTMRSHTDWLIKQP